MDYLISIDWGATSIRIGVFSISRETLLAEWNIPMPTHSNAHEIIEKTVQHIKGKCSEGGFRWKDFVGLAVGLAALHDSEGCILAWPNRPEWVGIAFRDLLAAQTGLQVLMLDDAEAAAFGEWKYGEERNIQHLLMVTVGTGIGSGMVLNGKIYKGYRNASGELGHLSIEMQGRPCICGGKGCLQMYASGRAIENQAQQVYKTDIKTWRASQVFQLAKEGEPQAQIIIEEAIEGLATGLASAIRLIDPEVVIVGGGIIQRHSEFYKDLEVRIRARLGYMPHKEVNVYLSNLGERTALWGGLSAWIHYSTIQNI